MTLDLTSACFSLLLTSSSCAAALSESAFAAAACPWALSSAAWADAIRRVVVLAPSHRVPFRGIALSSADVFETPLGDIPVDMLAVKGLTDLPGVLVLDAAFAEEHALEVQLPFLQAVLPDFTLVPLIVGDADSDDDGLCDGIATGEVGTDGGNVTVRANRGGGETGDILEVKRTIDTRPGTAADGVAVGVEALHHGDLVRHVILAMLRDPLPRQPVTDPQRAQPGIDITAPHPCPVIKVQNSQLRILTDLEPDIRDRPAPLADLGRHQNVHGQRGACQGRRPVPLAHRGGPAAGAGATTARPRRHATDSVPFTR